MTVRNITATGSIYLKNNFDRDKTLKVTSLSDVFKPTDSLVTVGAHDSLLITVNYKPVQNITDRSFIVFYSVDSTASVTLLVSGMGSTGDSYQTSTFDKFDADLKNALNSLVINHTSLGYNTARDRMFEVIDKQPGDTIECVYTGTKIKAATRTAAQNQGFDTEHTWPQGTFSQNEPMRSDIYHLYPTSSTANNKRSNYPFGAVTGTPTWTSGGSKLGPGSTGATVFEPRDVHKGNVARSMLYFITRYPSNYGSFFSAAQESAFRIWNKFDPVDSRELQRNAGIALYQNKRNPFIDHLEFVDRIYSFLNNTSPLPTANLNVFPPGLSFDTVLVNGTGYASLWLINTGDKVLTISNKSISNPVFSFENIPVQIAGGSMVEVILSFKPTTTGSFQGMIEINSDGGTFNGVVKGVSDISTGINVEETPAVLNNSFALKQNYPNPFNPETKIGFSVPNRNGNSSFVKLAVYDVIGNEIAVLVNDERAPGEHVVSFDATNLPGGIYFCRMEADGFNATTKLVLLK
ncbi:MAG: hypothetical protein IFNCLDLE_00991 [Ignavibacteriaceae bacterium]|nr:hypothetical protein [Ignavibacteriaceae bacterium]